MARPESIEIRGFDSYPVTLGDELRGERASMGKSLLDVQRELRIKAAHIAAIENADPMAIPYRGFVTGYVRAYARYLGMDEDVVLRRFCAESGFTPPGAAIGARSARTTGAAAPRADLDALIAGSRLAAASRAASVNRDFGSTLRGLGSLVVLATLLGGLGWAGWTVLQNVQRVTFAPLPDAPEALADAPDLGAMTRLAAAAAASAPAVDAAALAAVYAAQEVAPPRLALRDGPISALDPQRSGIYADAARAAEPAAEAAPTMPDQPPVGGHSPQVAVAAPPHATTADAPAQTAAAPPARQGAAGVGLVIASEAWVRVRDAAGATVHEGLMRPGQTWRAPADREGLTLRAGNAGGVFIDVDGALFGPLGRPGAVVSQVILDPEHVRSAYPPARAEAAPTASTTLSAALAAAPTR
jgi:cytoskeletal protein RodZ